MSYGKSVVNLFLRCDINSETSGKLKNAWHWLTIPEASQF